MPRAHLIHALFALLCVLVVVACGGRPESKGGTLPDEEPGPQTADPRQSQLVRSKRVFRLAGAPVLGEGVSALEQSCEPATEEEPCNGRDDDCDGRTDEGCGLTHGALQIAVRWDQPADVDLYVTEPSGETLSHQHTQSSGGGAFGRNGRGACRDDESGQLENAAWQAAELRSGSYHIDLHYYAECTSVTGLTWVTVSVGLGGRSVGTYELSLAPSDHMRVLSFEVR